MTFFIGIEDDPENARQLSASFDAIGGAEHAPLMVVTFYLGYKDKLRVPKPGRCHACFESKAFLGW